LLILVILIRAHVGTAGTEGEHGIEAGELASEDAALRKCVLKRAISCCIVFFRVRSGFGRSIRQAILNGLGSFGCGGLWDEGLLVMIESGAIWRRGDLGQ
jgi:hypothetical protein